MKVKKSDRKLFIIYYSCSVFNFEQLSIIIENKRHEYRILHIFCFYVEDFERQKSLRAQKIFLINILLPDLGLFLDLLLFIICLKIPNGLNPQNMRRRCGPDGTKAYFTTFPKCRKILSMTGKKLKETHYSLVLFEPFLIKIAGSFLHFQYA